MRLAEELRLIFVTAQRSATTHSPFQSRRRSKKKEVTTAALEIISCREGYSDLSLAQMYAPDDQPEDLRRCHERLDLRVEALYQTGSFKTDEEKLAALFKWHKKMNGDANA